MARPKNDGKGRMGGRQKGTPNKATKDLKEWVKDLIDDNREQVIDDLKDLEPKDRIAVIERLLKYILPTGMQITQTNGTGADELLNKIYQREPHLVNWIRFKYMQDHMPPDTLFESNYITYWLNNYKDKPMPNEPFNQSNAGFDTIMVDPMIWDEERLSEEKRQWVRFYKLAQIYYDEKLKDNQVEEI